MASRSDVAGGRIRKLSPPDAEAFVRLRREALVAAPLAFSASPEDDRASDEGAAREVLDGAPPAVVFGAFDDDLLLGMVGVYPAPKRKAAHKAHVWGMYVAPEGRGRGLARALLERAIRHARGLPGVSQVHLSVTDRAASARRLYESLGFVPWGTARRALRHEGEWADEIHLMLEIGTEASTEVR